MLSDSAIPWEALDAATGDLLWHYARKLPENVRPAVKRNVALYGDRLFVATSDAHLVALDIKTGWPVWDHAVARPGEPGGDSWNGLPLEKRSGGSLWTAGSYDPELNLAYFGVGQTYDTGRWCIPSTSQASPAMRFTPTLRWAESRNREAGLVLPARAQRSVGPRLGLRAAIDSAPDQWRHQKTGHHSGQNGPLRCGGRSHGQVRLFYRSGSAECCDGDRSQYRVWT